MDQKPIAQGRTADVYAGEAGRILKVVRPEFGPHLTDYEAKIAAQVEASGVECPRFFGLTEFQGRSALVYERIAGAPMTDLVLRQPWRVPYFARRMARLHERLHAPDVDGELPKRPVTLGHQIAGLALLSDDLKGRLLARLAGLPDDRRLCHGDLHPGNILCAGDRDVAIDWIDVAAGHPLADVARSSVILLGEAAVNPNPLVGWVARWFHAEYLRTYLRSEADRTLYRAFLPIVAAARLSEGIIELQGWLLKQAGKCG